MFFVIQKGRSLPSMRLCEKPKVDYDAKNPRISNFNRCFEKEPMPNQNQLYKPHILEDIMSKAVEKSMKKSHHFPRKCA